jgi:hypothetical protein
MDERAKGWILCDSYRLRLSENGLKLEGCTDGNSSNWNCRLVLKIQLNV